MIDIQQEINNAGLDDKENVYKTNICAVLSPCIGFNFEVFGGYSYNLGNGGRSMKVRLEGITMLANNVSALADFYREVIGFKTVIEEDHYVEFENSGIRLAICSKALMAENTNQHLSFIEERKGQAFELFEAFISKGATAISEPKTMSWGHTTGFFADPEGNIHSIFAMIVRT